MVSYLATNENPNKNIGTYVFTYLHMTTMHILNSQFYTISFTRAKMDTNKVVNRLRSLAVNASLESIQTVAKWITFNRKEASLHCSAILNEIKSCSGIHPTTDSSSNTFININKQQQNEREALYLSVIDEILITDLHSTTSKWKRNEELRNLIGKLVLQPLLRDHIIPIQGDDGHYELITKLLQKWDTSNSFSDPTIIPELRNLVEIANTVDTTTINETPVLNEKNNNDHDMVDNNLINKDADKTNTQKQNDVTSYSNIDTTSSDQINKQSNLETMQNDVTKETVAEHNNESMSIETKEIKITETNPSSKTSPKESTTTKDTDTETKKNENTDNSNETNFDKSTEIQLPPTNLPILKVEAQHFLEPCKSIATMQIAREIRNDTASRLWNILKTIPNEVEDYIKSIQNEKDDVNNNNNSNIDNTQKLDLSKLDELPTMSDEILDLDITDALHEVKQFRDVVVRQRQARKKCIDLLIQSQCQFGAMEAAQAFEDFGVKLRQVKKQKLTLSDAMALEGWDFVEDGGDEAGDEDGTGDGEVLESFPWFKKD